MDEIDRLPDGFLDEVLLARAFDHAYAANQAHVPGWERSPLRTIVTEIEHELAAEEIASRG